MLSVKKIFKILKIPKVAYLLAVKCICGIPFGIFQSMFSIVAMEYFKLGPKENGIVLSYVGILSIVSSSPVCYLLNFEAKIWCTMLSFLKESQTLNSFKRGIKTVSLITTLDWVKDFFEI